VRIRTDDEVYRVDAVWLGPPKATFPWRARYVAWAVGIPIFLVALTIERMIGISFGFFSTAWGFIGTIVITRLITAKISHERPLGAVVTMWGRELMAPRERTSGEGGAVSASRVRVRATRPLPKNRRRSGTRRQYPSSQQPRQYPSSSQQPRQYHGAQGKPRAGRALGPVSAGR
jgi:hypothetical protein